MRTKTQTGHVEWIDLRQAVERFPFSRRTFWGWITAGKLPAFKVGRRKTLIRSGDVERLITASPVRGRGRP